MAGAEGDDNAETFSDSNPTPEDAGNLQILFLKRDRIHDEISRFKLWFETNNLSTSASRLRVRLRDFVRIEALDDATPDLEQATTRLYFENAYYDLCADVEDAIEQKRVNTSSPAPQGNAPTSTPSPSVQSLPIVIKPFSGIYTEWLPFYNTLKTQKVSTFTAAVNRNSTQSTCYFCKKSHLIYNCVTFSKLSVSERRSQVDRLKLCQNCLKPSHTSDSCKSMSCKLCQLKHNTLLHSDQPSHSNENQPSTSGVYCSSALFPQAVLSTAIILIKDCKNKFQKFRALLDVGSESHFITEAATNKLGLSTENANVVVAGIQCSNTTARQKVQVQIESLHYSFTTALNCLVIPKISKNIPARTFSKDELDIPEAVKLADPNFNLSQPIDLLIGAGLFWQLLCVGQIQTIGHGLILQKTLLGWIVGGPLHGCPTSNTRQNLHCAVNNVSLENQVEKFWKLESYSNDDKPLTALEIQHENYFINNATQLSNGRFQVRLTFNEFLPNLGNPTEIALKRFNTLERKFAKNVILKINYQDFMKEYINLGHMRLLGPLTEHRIESEPYYLLPHHAVFKNDGATDKIRVVFDGSAKPLFGKSINACLSTGPKVQNDIFDLIIRFRTYRFAFTADICKMYRQILIHPEDRRYQRILWRDDPTQPMQVYELNTVTYGMLSAPYAAIKCLRLLADQVESTFPKAAEIIKDNFYVDDVLCGSSTVGETMELRDQLTQVLSQGRFTLAKWASNNPNIVPQETPKMSVVKFDQVDNESKTLGLVWDTQKDAFKYSIDNLSTTGKVSKRKILSVSSKLYDPLGLLGPVTVLAKILLQEIWNLKLSWDETVPLSIYFSWKNWLNDLKMANEITIPRFIFETDASVELHCFSDASIKAYGGAIYVRCIKKNGQVNVNLLCAKSRVAPLKATPLPRLELCAALLVCQLCDAVLKTVKVPIQNKYFWTDSKIALAWISSPSSSLKTFVANRVAEIQNLSSIEEWRYVPSISNPADIISRGTTANKLLNNDFWFHGPSFLSYTNEFWPIQEPVSKVDLPEQKQTTSLLVNTVPEWEYLKQFSDFIKLQRSIAYLNRFVTNIGNKNNQNYGPLSCSELDLALTIILRHIQSTEFDEEIRTLSNNLPLKPSSKLLCLNPFLDKDGILRVGGRLNLATTISDYKKHPYLLPRNHHVTMLIISHIHLSHLHAGPQATLAILREKFWVLTGRNVVRKIIQKCMRCYRLKPQPCSERMGNLPSYRIEPSRPFSKTGLDYCGPININLNRGRGRPKISKAYIAVFICMATKAVHLELVSDCTTESFLQALKRFVGRRGKPNDIFSDNGTTFVGAKNEMQRLLSSRNDRNYIIKYLTTEQINFHFIPPSAPHMGGIWEAAVKSAKNQLKRVIGTALFNFEEMQTLLIQVEACLNSRPLTSISNDPNDLTPLTPGHFLVGTPLTAVPEDNVTTLPTNRLSRWQQISRTQQQFWKRWSAEYLGQLQNRPKWTKASHNNIKVDDLVVIKEDHTPPLAWKMGRVTTVHPGQDGLIRVVTVKTANGVTKRPVVKLCVLPTEP
ncbi:uncharacterized protein LOC135128239 [Zophobas morio]|uniref:uncharacterized protein LOC135128239 n=1 Tax=Zophobas morio TaxID=2755281 RepID=UPI003083D51C